MRLHLLIGFGLINASCASTVGPNDERDASAAVDRNEERDADTAVDRDATEEAVPLCSTRLRSCSRDASPSGCNEACDYCVEHAESAGTAGVFRTPPFCGRYDGFGCNPGSTTRSCTGGGVPESLTCLSHYVSNDPTLPTGFPSSSGECYGAETCLEVLRREVSFPAASRLRDRCWYSDRTVATSGRPGPAECVDQPFRSCGSGCESCPDGYDCVWRSERSPTGICLLRTGMAPSGSLVSIGCWSPFVPGRACPEGQSCLKPLRGDADGVPDRDRPGLCVPEEQCLAVASRFTPAYRCDNSPPATR